MIAKIIIFGALFLTGLIKGSEGSIRVSRIVSPDWIEVGGSVTLECEWQVQSDTLYSVKWYQGMKEIYRYTPSKRQPLMVFENKHLNVDVTQSKLGKVRLSNLTLGASGLFRCEVSGDAPAFYTDYSHVEMKVVALPEAGPVIQGVAELKKVGDLINLTCVSSPSMPPVHLTFLINGEQADLLSVEPQRTQLMDNGLRRTVLRMQFRLRQHMLREGGVCRVRCQARLDDFYQTEDEKLIKTEPRYRAFMFGRSAAHRPATASLYGPLLVFVGFFLRS